jgi:lipid-A-disaccharide synthase
MPTTTDSSPRADCVIALVAGEPSGDQLGRGLMAALRARCRDVRFIGIGGPGMQAEGLASLAPIEQLSVNGLVDPMLKLPALLRLERMLIDQCRHHQVAAFIGIDFNVFNLRLERRLRRQGVRTVHYVSPSVYAWRRGRTRRVAAAADLLLALFPFEPALYAGLDLRVVCVGHRLADAIDPDRDRVAEQRAARAMLGLPTSADVVALLPGSRASEVMRMAPVVAEAAGIILAERPETRFVVPCIRPAVRDIMIRTLSPQLASRFTWVDGRARDTLAASDAAIVKSGTSTLEAMLMGCPMVVTYKLGGLTYRIVRALLRTPWVALPNILAGRAIVPELLQDAATPAALASALLAQLDRARIDDALRQTFLELHRSLRRDADRTAARAVLHLIDPHMAPMDDRDGVA